MLLFVIDLAYTVSATDADTSGDILAYGIGKQINPITSISVILEYVNLRLK